MCVRKSAPSALQIFIGHIEQLFTGAHSPVVIVLVVFSQLTHGDLSGWVDSRQLI